MIKNQDFEVILSKIILIFHYLEVDIKGFICTHVFCIIGQAFRLRRLLIGAGPSKKRQYGNAKKQSWMTPISHGYHVVEDQSCRGDLDVSDCDSVVVQREQLDEIELWFFGVFDAQVGDSVARFMQSHFFDRKLKPVSNVCSYASWSTYVFNQH